MSVRHESRWDIRWHMGEDYVNVSRRADERKRDAQYALDKFSAMHRALSWKYPYPAPANIPSKLTATQIKGRVLDSEITQDAPAQSMEEPIYRPNFIVEQRGLTAAQRGTALHLVMEKLDLKGDLTPAGIRTQMEQMLANDLLTTAQMESVPVNQVAQFFASREGERVTRAKTCRREFKFSMLTDATEYFPEAVGEAVLLQGVVDLWFEDEDGITVVDFKSDRILPGEETKQAEFYRSQLKAYSKALQCILGAEKIRTVLWFFKTATAVEL